MSHHATPRFWALYRALPADIRRLADEAYARLRSNPRHPGLQFKKVGDAWSVRVGVHHRALAAEVDDVFSWFWIGPHAEYDKLLGR